MVLVDTSVLVDYLNGTTNLATKAFDDIAARGVPWGITDYIYQELLQGASSPSQFRSMREYLDTQIFYSLLYGRESYAKAAFLYYQCRKAGVTPRSTIDLIIVQTAIENDLLLLHRDRDFIRIQSAIPSLRFFLAD